MADQRRGGIEWCDETWNVVRGCSRVSEGCRNCYAERQAVRMSGPGQPYEDLVRSTSAGPRWTGQVRLIDDLLDQPLRWKRPRRIFVNAMSDLFHESLTDEQLDQVFAVMALASQHTFQVLTKRPERMREYFADDQTSNRVGERVGWFYDMMGGEYPGWFFQPEGCAWEPLLNVWLGTSVENQETADERIPLLLETPAAVRWVSLEPMLGPVDLRHIDLTGQSDLYRRLDALTGWRGYKNGKEFGAVGNFRRDKKLSWLVLGGESGPGARPMHPNWARSVRDQCVAAGVPFLFKQQGAWMPVAPMYADHLTDAALDAWTGPRPVPVDLAGHLWREYQPPQGSWLMARVGKKRAGRLLDGRTWDQYPEVAG